MENASKALLIAGGVFLAILIISVIVVAYNEISAHYANEHNHIMIEQAQKFNAQFENYHRDNIRGSDLISLMNKVIDYNITDSYQDGTNYERIRVTITLGDNEILEQFKGEYDDGTISLNKYLVPKITNTSASGDQWINDKKLVEIANTPDDLCEKAGFDITDNQLQHLASNISKIMVDETSTESYSAIGSRLDRKFFIKDILNIDINVDEETGITKGTESAKHIKTIKEIASQYYQYMQFKRAYFKCTEILYDTETNRVEEMNFELQIEDDKVVFN